MKIMRLDLFASTFTHHKTVILSAAGHSLIVTCVVEGPAAALAVARPPQLPTKSVILTLSVAEWAKDRLCP